MGSTSKFFNVHDPWKLNLSFLRGSASPDPPGMETKFGGRGEVDYNFSENPGFLRKFLIFVKNSDFRENLGFSRKSWIFAKNLVFGKIFGFLRKSEILRESYTTRNVFGAAVKLMAS